MGTDEKGSVMTTGVAPRVTVTTEPRPETATQAMEREHRRRRASVDREADYWRLKYEHEAERVQNVLAIAIRGLEAETNLEVAYALLEKNHACATIRGDGTCLGCEIGDFLGVSDAARELFENATRLGDGGKSPSP